MQRLRPVLAILLLAAAVRIINAGHWPVWTDEGWSTWAASDHHVDVILNRVSQDRHPPLYFLSLSAWWTLAGDSRISLRFLSIASGLLATAAVYRIAADWFGRRAGQYAVLLFAILHVAVYYSQEIRHYGWLVLSVCLMMLFFLRYLRRPGVGLLIAYTLSIAFMLYSLYIGVLVLAVQIAIGLLIWRGSWQHKLALIGAWLAALILYTPWLVALAQQLNILVGGIDGYPTTLASLLTVSTILLGGQIALTGGLYALGTWHIVERRDTSARWLAQITIVLGGIGLLALMFVANLRIGLLSARTLVFLTPMLMIISGYGLSLITGRTRYVLAILLVIIVLATPDFVQPRLDYQAAAQAIAADYTPGDLVILETGWDDNAFRYELILALGESTEPQIIRTLPWVDNRGNDDKPVVPQIEGIFKTYRRVWVVNWLLSSQVMPFLDAGNDGFHRALTLQTPTGQQYQALYADPTVRATLYERWTADDPAFVYGDLLKLLPMSVQNTIAPGSHLPVDLWWTAQKPLPLDYSVGVFIMDSSGTVRTQHDGPPDGQPTTQWKPGESHFDRHILTIPSDLPPGDYRIGVQVYWYGDRQPLPVNGQPYAMVGQVKIQ